MRIVRDISDLIGNTPMICLNHLTQPGDAKIYAKLESYNPGGSIKDRICYAMVEDAEEHGWLKPGYTIVEPTAGNTGIGLSIVAIAKGYNVVLTMPENVSREKYSLLLAYGVDIILTPEDSGMAGAIWEAEDIVRRKPRHYMPNQFCNAANPEAHRSTTAQEIIGAFDQPIDVFVTGVGTGGTLTGVGEELKKRSKKTKVVAVEPSVSPVLSGGSPAPTRIDGIGAGMVPKVLNVDIMDQVITVSDEDAYDMMKRISKKEGLLVGISSGANMCAALQLACELGADKRLVTILCDTGERYLSLSDHFQESNGIDIE